MIIAFWLWLTLPMYAVKSYRSSDAKLHWGYYSLHFILMPLYVGYFANLSMAILDCIGNIFPSLIFLYNVHHPLVLARKLAKPFDVHWEKTQDFTGVMVIENGDIKTTDFRWGE